MSKTTKAVIEIEPEDHEVLKTNKQENGLSIGWQLSQAVKEYANKLRRDKK